MATPIKDTPVLMGDVARRFEKIIAENETTKISPQEYERIRNSRSIPIFNSMAEYKAYRANTVGA